MKIRLFFGARRAHSGMKKFRDADAEIFPRQETITIKIRSKKRPEIGFIRRLRLRAAEEIEQEAFRGEAKGRTCSRVPGGRDGATR